MPTITVILEVPNYTNSKDVNDCLTSAMRSEANYFSANCRPHCLIDAEVIEIIEPSE